MITSRTRFVFRPLALAMALAFAGGAIAAEDIDKVNGAIRAQAGHSYGNLDTVNGSIRIEREAQAESASTVNGRIHVDDGAVVGSVETVNGGISIGQSAVVERDAETVNGTLDLARAARIEGTASTVNGRIALQQAQVNGGIHTVNGDILVGEGSTVRGGILVEKPSMGWFNWGEPKKPRVVIGPNAVVEGAMVFEREVELFVHTSAQVGRVEGAEPQRFSGATP